MKHIYITLTAVLLLTTSTAHTANLKPVSLSDNVLKPQVYGQLPINPNVFTDKSKDYIKYCINLWNKSAQEGKIDQNTGLAAVWSNLDKESIDSIINNEPGLAQANNFLADLVASPIYTAMPGIAAIAQLPKLTGAPTLAQQVTRVAIQAKFLSDVRTKFPQFNDIPENELLNAFALVGKESIPYNIEFLKNNQDLNTERFMPIGRGLVLVTAYLEQQNG